MNMMEKMMGFMMGRMSKEDKEEMMDKMMGEFFADMTAEDKQNMMAAMMPKMMEGMNFMEMMPQMMMGMMGGGEGKGGMGAPAAEAGAPGEGEGAHASMMQTMMTKMMPQCLEMMLPKMPQEERREFVLRMVSLLARKGCAEMSEEEKNDIVVGVNKRMESILGQGRHAA
jgi:hypothetical protein